MGQKQYWLAYGSSSMSCHVGSIPSATASLMFLFPLSPLLTEISLCIQCSVKGWVRFHISCQCWVYLFISLKKKLLPKETSPRELEIFCRTCLTSTFLVSPEICYYLLAFSHFEQTQEKPESSGSALSKQLWPACLHFLS